MLSVKMRRVEIRLNVVKEPASTISFYLAALRALRAGITYIELSRTDATPKMPSIALQSTWSRKESQAG